MCLQLGDWQEVQGKDQLPWNRPEAPLHLPPPEVSYVTCRVGQDILVICRSGNISSPPQEDGRQAALPLRHKCLFLNVDLMSKVNNIPRQSGKL